MWMLTAQGSGPVGDHVGPNPATPLGGWEGLVEWLKSGSPEELFWNWVSGMNCLHAALFVGAGLVYLLYGWKVFKILVVINAALLGAWAGHWLGQVRGLGWWPAPVGCVAFAALSWPFMRYAVSLMGGLAGAVLGVLAARSLGLEGPALAAGAVIGMATLGLLAFVFLRILVSGLSAVQGAVMTVGGLVAIVSRFRDMGGHIRTALYGHGYLLPLLVVVPAIIGFAYQFRRGPGQEKK